MLKITREQALSEKIRLPARAIGLMENLKGLKCSPAVLKCCESKINDLYECLVRNDLCKFSKIIDKIQTELEKNNHHF